MASDGDRGLGTLVRSLPSGVASWELGPRGALVLRDANPAAARRGLPAERAGQTLRALWPGLSETQRRRWTALAREGGPAIEADVVTPAGEPARVLVFSVSERSLGILFEDLDRDRETLRQFLDTVVENMPAMVFIKEARDLRFVRFNRAGEDLLGMPRDQLIGRSDQDFFPPDQARFFQEKDRQVLASGTVLDIPEEPIDTPGGRRWLHTRKIPITGTDGQPSHLLGISMDITERRAAQEALRTAHEELERRVAERTADLSRANAELLREFTERRRAEEALRLTEDQLRHAQKMEAVGRLAGGVAHDFNNLLSVVLGYGAIVHDELPDDSPLRTCMAEITKAGDRAAELTRQLLAFSRQQVLEPKVVDLNDVVRSIDLMLRRLVGEDVVFETRLAEDLGRVRVDVGQIEQVLVNLVVNARDAMPGGGRLTVETANVDLDEAYALDHPEAVPGPHVLLAISDDGTGMDKATQARVFEPFFTTKPRGKGTGLGLSTVFGIVKQSGGSIWLYSEPGRGTTFKVYLPRVDLDADAPAERAVAGAGGDETILLVEDEPQVRELAAHLLDRFGYHVVQADPEEAVALAERWPEPIHLLLTDVVMPAITGRELADRIRRARPGIKVLFMSGYTGEAVVRNGALEPGISFLQKPITPETLSRKVREVLDGT